MSRRTSRSVSRLGVGGPPVRAGTTDGTQQERRVERRHDRLPSLVLAAAWQPAPIAGIFYRVTGQDPVAHRSATVEGRTGQAGGHRVTNVLKMRGTAADHRPDAGDGVVVAGQ